MRYITILCFMLFVFTSIAKAQNSTRIICQVQSDKPVRALIQEPFDYMSGQVGYIDTCCSKGYSNCFILKRNYQFSRPTYLRVVLYDNQDVFISLTEFVVCPNDSLTINLHLKDGNVYTSFNGANAEGNKYFNKVRNDRVAFYAPLNNYLKIFTANRFAFITDVLRISDAYNHPYFDLLKNGKITVVYYNAMCTSSKLTVANFIASEMRFGRAERLRGTDASFRIFAQRVLFDTILPMNDYNFALMDGSSYLLDYVDFLSKPIKDTILKDSIIQSNGNLVRVHSIFYPLLFVPNPEWRELLWVSNLAALISISPEMPDNQIDVFAAIFPNSKHTPFLRDFYKKKHLKEIFVPSPFSTIIADSTGKYKSLDDIIKKHFKDKNVFIDIWATWCGPCKDEFKYNHYADSALKSNGIERLYISIDAPKYQQSWISDIRKYNLGGIHIIAGKELMVDLEKRIPFTGIPHFAIINSSGKIVDTNAKRPSYKHLFIDNIKEKTAN